MFLRPGNTKKNLWMFRAKLANPDPWVNDHYEFVPASDGVTNQVFENTCFQPATLNPLLCELDRRSALQVRFGASTDQARLEMADLMTHPGTWREMQLADPPCVKLNSYAQVRLNTVPEMSISIPSSLRSPLDINISDPAGITLGYLMKTLTADPQWLEIYENLTWRQMDTEQRKGTRVEAVIFEWRDNKRSRKGHLIKSLTVSVGPDGMVFPQAGEWEAVERLSTGTARNMISGAKEVGHVSIRSPTTYFASQSGLQPHHRGI